MIEKLYQKLTRRSIAIVLVVAIVFVFVLGDKYWVRKKQITKSKQRQNLTLLLKQKLGISYVP